MYCHISPSLPSCYNLQQGRETVGSIFKSKAERLGTRQNNYRGVGPEGTLAAVAAGSARRAGVLAEVVVAGDGLSAEVAHEAPAAARHPVAALRLDQARPALHTLPHPSCRHALLAAARGTWTDS